MLYNCSWHLSLTCFLKCAILQFLLANIIYIFITCGQFSVSLLRWVIIVVIVSTYSVVFLNKHLRVVLLFLSLSLSLKIFY